jgi:UDP-N-acetylmuramoyl-L-alanyl-D-glutamate--2,6-diaminopimelate ligase
VAVRDTAVVKTRSHTHLGDVLGSQIAGRHADVLIGGVETDSRRVEPGDVFFARPGLRTDGRQFVQQAVRSGAAAIVMPAGSSIEGSSIPCVTVSQFDQVLGRAAAVVHGDPSADLRLVGVTGTNGKTTVAHLLAQCLSADTPCGVIGTLGFGLSGQLTPSLHTTPEVELVQGMLAQFLEQRARHTVMEVSSHGVEQGRIEGLRFETAVFTNLSRDHLDYHGDMRVYAAAKARLFQSESLVHGIFNTDDVYASKMSSACSARVWHYSLDSRADDSTLVGRLVDNGALGLTLAIDGPWGAATLTSPLIGRFNAYNLLAALAVLLTGDTALDDACNLLSTAQPAPGRMQCLGGGDSPLVVIDYSHTPDSLRSALQALRPVTTNTLWCVFGCGGDRDIGKRSEMGAIADRDADRVVVTDDNPRSEHSASIIEDIVDGIERREGLHIEADRDRAIAFAIDASEPGDVVLIAGKGHENYQERDGERLPFSDLAAARIALNAYSVRADQ